MAAILADSNSLSMVISPTLDCSRAISSSRSSRSRSFRADAAPGQRSIPPFGQLGHRDIRFPGDDIQRFATQQTRHHRHLALDGIALRSCIDARGGARASYGGALRSPLGLSALYQSSFSKPPVAVQLPQPDVSANRDAARPSGRRFLENGRNPWPLGLYAGTVIGRLGCHSCSQITAMPFA